ncbi:3-dehydroquinate synthase [Criblamydia sequanensis]|uniref:3-dehydroquinate synthase n=1 Tax=Candidatus Criblamydia sequanensis CRIB-18 TaxID=1437425 RepID=A0A090D2S2_9BACT|nr:3-dehydroquinate synthase [Criblamydia sequanensis]CDR34885.1 3-dehydroquinate synthase [Criblamydia sequanensis CRIB-18]
MTKKIQCQIPQFQESYEIEIGTDLLKEQADYLKNAGLRVAIITDDNVEILYGKKLKEDLLQSGLDAYLFSFSSGESHKTRATKELLENRLLENGLGKDTCIIALGGGVVTDVSGYLAATYCRGLPLVMIPTSLLGMVDASIGGKTGVNVPQGKNMIGCIYQPKKVILDLNVLKSLPKKEYINGFVEIIKHGVIADYRLFCHLENNAEALLAKDSALLEQVIFESCRIKKEIVEQDEKEKGKRSLLNFGHTVGHALENLTNHALSHGEAVAIGLIVESYLSLQMGKLDQNSFDRIKKILVQYGLPLRFPSQVAIDDIVKTMILDKKSRNGEPRFILIEEIGSPLSSEDNYCFPVEKMLFKKTLEWMNHDFCCH